MTILEITRLEVVGGEDEHRRLPENTSVTVSLSAQEIGHAISDVVARADRDYAIDLITALQLRVRLAEDTGERLSLAEFATQEGFSLARLRAE
jgi:hypothetical protein